MKNFPDSPEIIQGGQSIDDRGNVIFNNNLNLTSWKRFYIVSNHSVGFVRAWHGHKKESKIVIPIGGTSLVSCVKIDNWDNPNKDMNPLKFVISMEKANALFIPSGYANGFKTLTSDAKLLFLSSSNLEESLDDDIRYAWNYWNPWEPDFR